MSEKGCQKECQKIGQKECQKGCQKDSTPGRDAYPVARCRSAQNEFDEICFCSSLWGKATTWMKKAIRWILTEPYFWMQKTRRKS